VNFKDKEMAIDLSKISSEEEKQEIDELLREAKELGIDPLKDNNYFARIFQNGGESKTLPPNVERMKLHFESFKHGFKHGAYIFVNDSCEFCSQYKRNLEKIETKNIFIVECNLQQEKAYIRKHFKKGTFPNLILFQFDEPLVEIPGLLEKDQIGEVVELMKKFNLTEELSEKEIEIKQKEKMKRRKVMLTLIPKKLIDKKKEIYDYIIENTKYYPIFSCDVLSYNAPENCINYTESLVRKLDILIVKNKKYGIFENYDNRLLIEANELKLRLSEIEFNLD
jgi:hypothetical protein